MLRIIHLKKNHLQESKLELICARNSHIILNGCHIKSSCFGWVSCKSAVLFAVVSERVQSMYQNTSEVQASTRPDYWTPSRTRPKMRTRTRLELLKNVPQDAPGMRKTRPVCMLERVLKSFQNASELRARMRLRCVLERVHNLFQNTYHNVSGMRPKLHPERVL